MATLDLAFNTRLDGVVVLQTLLTSGIQTGDSVTIAGNAVLANGTYTVANSEPYEFIGRDDEGDFLFDYAVIMDNQFLIVNAGADVSRTIAAGTVAFTPSPQWVTSANVIEWLGIDPSSANDTAFVATCVSASNYWSWNKRRESGYADSLSAAPNASVRLAATMYAATLYRERGTSGDSYASYDGFGNMPQPVTLARIMQLLGCNRSQIG